MVVMVCGSVSEVKEEQHQKTLLPIVVMVGGSVSEIKEVQQ